jgi:hypothetical protein
MEEVVVVVLVVVVVVVGEPASLAGVVKVVLV